MWALLWVPPKQLRFGSDSGLGYSFRVPLPCAEQGYIQWWITKPLSQSLVPTIAGDGNSLRLSYRWPSWSASAARVNVIFALVLLVTSITSQRGTVFEPPPRQSRGYLYQPFYTPRAPHRPSLVPATGGPLPRPVLIGKCGVGLKAPARKGSSGFKTSKAPCCRVWAQPG